MKNIFIRLLFILILLLILAMATGCTLPTHEEASSAQGAIEIFYPQDGAQLSEGEMVDIQSHLIEPSGLTTVVLYVNAEEVRNDRFSGNMTEGNVYQPWIPPGPGTYVLQVNTDSSGSSSQSSPITVYVGEKAVEEIEESEKVPPPGKDTPTITLTATITLTPTITMTVTPDESTATGIQNSNCRSGPGQVYDILDAVREGETTTIVGRNAAGTWLVVNMIRGSGTCWVYGDLVETSGSLDHLTIYKDPPTPVPTKTNTTVPTTAVPPAYSACHDYPDLGTCNADPMGFGVCSWDTGLNKCQP